MPNSEPARNSDVPFQTLYELADGVFVWLQPGGETGVANAGVVVDDDGLTVVDTLMVRSQWEPFAAAVADLEQRVRRTVLTHAHIDHVGGTKAFPHAAVYATPMTSAVLDDPMPIDGYKKFMPAFEDEFDDLAELGTRAVTHEVQGAAYLTPRVEVLPASGHTSGDLLVLVADVDVCFAGDLCFFGVTPTKQRSPAKHTSTTATSTSRSPLVPLGARVEPQDAREGARARRRHGLPRP